jgi:hypothetical protein
MKAVLIGITFLSLATTSVLAQDEDGDGDGNNLPCPICQVIRPPKYNDCGSTKCGKQELAQDRKIKEELRLLTRAHHPHPHPHVHANHH